ncbi:MAG: hypothetical protein GVY17_08080 [Cyanobacteria bacterium]|nr:hypothetical protein [Cyanobacteria bacterium GSL.Bin21]
MANIDIQSTTEGDNGWSYQVKLDEGRSSHQYQVTLSRADYEQWSQGQAEPEQVIRAAFDFLLKHEPASAILSEFDCSVIRRYFPEVDRELPKKL